MASDKGRWRNVDRSQDEKPAPNETIVYLLERYGIPYDRIYGRFAKGDSFTSDNRFGNYAVRLVGVSTDEELPQPLLAWQLHGEEYYCWQIVIRCKDYPGLIDATWREEYDHYEVVTIWGSLKWMNSQTVALMDEGLKLLLLISERMIKVMRGGTAPWQIAIKIAARETIPGYTNNEVSANTLKNIAILPDNNTK